MNFRTVTVGELALVLIAVFVVLAFFNGWGQMPEWQTYDFRIRGKETRMTAYRERMQAGEYDKPKADKADKPEKPKADTPKRPPGRPRKTPTD